MFMNNLHRFNYGDSKVWKCTYSNGSAPAISISPSTPFPTPLIPKMSPPPPPTPSSPPPAPKKSPPPPTPTLPPPTPKKSTPTLPPPMPKNSPSPPSTPSLPPPTPKNDQPSNPPPEHHHHQNPWEHIESCMINMGPLGMCRWQMEVSFHTRLFRVSNYCCNLVTNMRSECDDVAWGFFTDPFFLPLVRYTCHVNC